MADLKTIMRYINVRAHAEKGVPGERDNARDILAKMEAENPGIKEEAEAILRAQDEGQKRSAGGARPDPFAGFRTGNWENIFQFVSQAATYAYDFAQQAANAQHGAWLAQKVTAYTRSTRSGRWVIGLKMDADTFWQAKGLNRAQKEMFRNELHELLDEQLNEMLDQHPQEHTW